MSVDPPTTPAATSEPPAPPRPVKPRWRRWTRKILKMAAAVYIGLAIVFYFLQTWMIFPGAATQGTREAIAKPAPDQELVPLHTASGEKIYVLFSPAQTAKGFPHPDAAHRPTI